LQLNAEQKQKVNEEGWVGNVVVVVDLLIDFDVVVGYGDGLMLGRGCLDLKFKCYSVRGICLLEGRKEIFLDFIKLKELMSI